MIKEARWLSWVETHGGIVTTKQARDLGLSRALLSQWAKKGKIIRLAQGQYALPNEIPDEMFALSARSSHYVLSHETALWLDCISDRPPYRHSVTTATGNAPSIPIRKKCKVYYVKAEYLDLGKTTLLTPQGNPVSSYDLERTLCDCFRSKAKMGDETVLYALKAYAARSDKNLNRLYDYAKKLRVSKAVRQYLEILL